MTPTETLQYIQHRLATESPAQIIEALVPKTAADALTWARRLSGWKEYPFAAQVIGVARIVSKQAMKAFNLKLTPDGRIVLNEAKGQQNPKHTFRLAIAGEVLQVEHTPCYLPGDDTALFYFTNTPSKPHCLSDSGYLSQFVSQDVVDACGGPEAFASQFAEAKLQGTDFLAAFDGGFPEPSRRKTRKPAGHAAKIVAEPVAKPDHGMLF